MVRKHYHLGLGAAALVLLISGGVGFADGPIEVGPSCAADGGCAAGCCKTCQPVQRIVKVTKRVYGEKCEEFCVCKPTFLGGLFNLREAIAKDNGAYQGNCCGCGVCGQPHTKKYLVIRNRVHEECQQKCEIPGQAGPGVVVASPGSVADEPTTPALNPNQGPIIVPPGK